jgi:hypothetical protein
LIEDSLGVASVDGIGVVPVNGAGVVSFDEFGVVFFVVSSLGVNCMVIRKLGDSIEGKFPN